MNKPRSHCILEKEGGSSCILEKEGGSSCNDCVMKNNSQNSSHSSSNGGIMNGKRTTNSRNNIRLKYLKKLGFHEKKSNDMSQHSGSSSSSTNHSSSASCCIGIRKYADRCRYQESSFSSSSNSNSSMKRSCRSVSFNETVIVHTSPDIGIDVFEMDTRNIEELEFEERNRTNDVYQCQRSRTMDHHPCDYYNSNDATNTLLQPIHQHPFFETSKQLAWEWNQQRIMNTH